MANYYRRGQRVRLLLTFRDLDGALADPTAVTVEVRAPDATISTSAATKDSTGTYHYDLAIPDVAASTGTWEYRGLGSGALVAANEATFDVLPSDF